jgi:large repetitive protein
MKVILKIVAICLIIVTSHLGFGQIINTPFSSPALPAEKCGFDAIHQEKMVTDAIYRQKTLDFERDLPFLSLNKSAATYVIPCVVHVMETGNSLTAITDDQIRDAIRGLNDRFRKVTGTPGDGDGADLQIEYALAVRDPSGNCTNGIVRVNMTGNSTYMASGVRRSSMNGITDTDLKNLSRWTPTKYYNIWLISEIDNNNGGSGTQGYASFASSHGTNSDGTVMLVNSVKDPNATTFIHELGHSLNLYHTFEGDGGGGSCPTNTSCATQGDLCCDTPPHKRSSFDCVTATNTCTGTSTTLHNKNYMDYSSDVCQNMLTSDQRTRMHAAITGSRGSYLASNGNDALVPVSAPTVDFKASKTILCGTGSSVKFTDYSTCFPNTYMTETSWAGITYSWTITNGTTTYTSTLQNPNITFNATGTFNATLEITSSFGTHSKTISEIVIVSSAPPVACTPTSTNEANYNQTVNNVTFNTINNTTSILNNTAYSDFTCSSNTIVEPGSTHNLSISLQSGGSGREYVEVWIDWNNNAIIDAGEIVLTGSTATTNSSAIVSGNILIPETAVQNTLIRMRVMGETNNPPSAGKKNCTTTYFMGDVEDYGIYIRPACGVISGTTAGSRCGTGTVTLEATGNGTLNWYADATGGASLGTGSTFVTPSISSNTTYYVDATFNSCTSPSRTAVLASVLSTPATSTLSSPTNAATNVSTTPSFTWTAVSGATSYDIEIASDAGFSSIITSSNVLTNSYSHSPALNISTTYYWRVRAINDCGNGSFTSEFSFTTDNISCSVFASSDVPKTIIDNNSVTSTITIPSGVEISDINVLNLKGTHSYIQDVRITLRSPNNTTITLFSNVCAGEDNFDLNFDDAAASSTLPCPPIGGGTYIPSNLLSAFNGQNSIGTWTLTVFDNATGDTGNLNSWSLEICGTPCVAPTITSQPSASTICAGSNTTFSTSATGATGYQWQVDSGSGFNNISDGGVYSGATTSTLTITSATTGLNGNSYRCVTIGSCGNTNTNSVTLTVNPSLTPSVAVASDDADNTICEGTNVTFTATPTNGGTSPTYQWTLNSVNVGTNSPTYSNNSLTSVDIVSCLMTSNAVCASPTTVTSGNLSLTVNPNVTPSVSIASNDADNTICSGTNVTFTATPTNGGASPSYQWKLNGANVGSNSSTYANASLSDGDEVSCVLNSNATCLTSSTATSNTVTITVTTSITPSISIVSNDADNSICAGTSVTFTATPNNGGSSPAYQWKLNGSNVGTNSDTYSNNSLANNDEVSCVLTSNDACASPTTVTSSTITMTVNSNVTPSVAVASDDADNTICEGTNVTFTATPTNGGTSPTYQWTLNSVNVGSNSPTYSNNSLTSTDIISCLMTSNAVCASPTTVTSGNLSLTVNPNVTPSVSIASNDADNTICNGTNVTFTATPTNGGASPSYQWKLNGANVGSNSSTYANASLSDGDEVSCVLTSNATCLTSATATSNTVTITVSPAVSIMEGVLTNPSSCGNNDGSIEIENISADGVLSWTGTSSGNITVTASNTAIVPNLTAGSYSISFNDGCPSNTINSSLSDPGSLPAPTITTSGSTTFCQGGSVTLISSADDNNVWSTGETTKSIVVNSSDTYSVSIQDGACSSGSSFEIVTVNANPVIGVDSQNNPSACAGNDGSIIINGITTGDLTWGGTSTGSLNGISGPNATISGLTAGNYTIDFNDGCGSNTLNVSLSDPSAPATPTITASGSTTICDGNSVTLTSSSATNNNWSTGESTQSISVSTAGTYSVSVTISGCTSGSSSETIIVNPIPSISLGTSVNPSSCGSNDGSIEVSGLGTGTISWSGASSGSENINSANYTITGLMAGNYSIEFDNGCLSNTLNSSLSDPGAPSTPTITVNGNTALCTGGSVELVSSYATGNVWSNGETTQTIIVDAIGDYSVSFTDAGCTASSSVVNITAASEATIFEVSKSNPTTCNGTDGSITIGGIGNGNLHISTPTSGGVDVIPVSGPEFTGVGLVAGTYTFMYDDGCPSNTLTIILTDPTSVPTPTITAGGSTTICFGETVTLTSSSETGNLWSTGETTQTIVANNTQTYSLTVTENLCTSASATIDIIVNMVPSISEVTSTIPSACGLSDGSIEITGLSNGVLSWTGTSSGSENINVASNYTVTGLSAGNYIFTFDNGCISNDLISSIGDPGSPATPTITTSGPTTFCAEGSVTLTSSSSTGNVWSTGETSQSITVTAAGTYSLAVVNGLCTSNSASITLSHTVAPIIAITSVNGTSSCGNNDGSFVIDGSGSGTLTWTGTNPGTQNVTLPTTISGLTAGSYSFIFNNGCNSNTVSSVIEDPNAPATPVVSNSGTSTFCEGQTRTLTSSISSNIVWSTGETTQSIVVSESGSYSVAHTVNGCTSVSNIVAITVNPLPTPAVISASGETTFCNGGSVVLSSDLASGNVWSTGATSQSITVTSSGNYSVTTAASGCTSTSNVISVLVNAVPTIALGGVTNVSTCGGTNGKIDVLGSGAGTVSWTGAASGSLGGTLPLQIQNLIPGSYTVTFNNGCNSNTLSATIGEPTPPTAPTITASGATTFCQGGTVTLSSSATTGNVWSTGATTQSITVNQSGDYSTTITSSPGCSATSNNIAVTVNAVPTTPTISANGPTTFCEGGNVILSSSSTSNNSWTGGSTNQNLTVSSSGTYSVTVTQNGCSATSTPISVTVNAIPTAPVITANGSTSFCEGESVTLSSNVTNGIVWTTGATGASIIVNTAGSFSVTRTVNGCSSTSNSITTSVNPVPNASIATIANVCDTALSFTLTQGSPAGGTYMVNGVSATNFTPSVTNIGQNMVSYTVTQNGCSATASTSFNVLNCSGVGLEELNSNILIYPNPTNGIIIVEGIDVETVKVVDKVGRIILTQNNNNTINLSEFSNGIYYIVIQTQHSESIQKVELIK